VSAGRTTEVTLRRLALLVATALTLAIFGADPARAATCTPISLDSSDVPRSIPGPPAVAESTLSIPSVGTVNDLNVHLDISHPFDSDLTIELVSPIGQAVILAEGVGTWGDGFASTTFDDEAAVSIVSGLPPFSGSFRPAEPLSAFEGIVVAGVVDDHSLHPNLGPGASGNTATLGACP
jgi:proprotein convertase P-domain-containing protein